MAPIRRFAMNASGRDFIVGDIHGCFGRLQTALDELGFDPERDRLFSVGDLVDRGPESHLSIEWLSKPWFHTVLGNHEQMAIDWANGVGMDASIYAYNGGGWNIGNTQAERQRFADAFASLPIAIELGTPRGVVGIVHADCPFDDWASMGAALEGECAEAAITACLWSRDRINSGEAEEVDNIRAVVVGHTPMKHHIRLGDIVYIDTGAVFGGHFTILDAATLQPAEVAAHA